MEEFWKDVPNYEGLYQVSNLGNVRSLLFNKTRVLKKSLSSSEYLIVTLTKNKKIKIFAVHQLIAISFLGHERCGHKMIIDHINDNKLDNRVENLQIVTSRFNVFKTKKEHHTSKYKGVHWDKDSEKWRASIRVGGKLKCLGRFKCELSASLAYQNKLKTL